MTNQEKQQLMDCVHYNIATNPPVPAGMVKAKAALVKLNKVYGPAIYLEIFAQIRLLKEERDYKVLHQLAEETSKAA
jgi:hypothetical protein